jgi:DHA1 family multidrug resistance protein-like MFS transporter
MRRDDYDGVQERPGGRAAAGRPGPEERGRADTLLGGKVAALLVAVGISFLSLGFLFPLYSLYAREAIGANSTEIGLMASTFLVAGFLSAPAIGSLADRLGHGRVLWIALATHSLVVLGYIAARKPEHLLGLRALEGVAAMGVLPPARALMNGMAPRHRQGEAMGLMSSAEMAGVLLGPAVGAVLASQVGFTGSFLVSGMGLGLVSAWVFFVLPTGGAETEVGSTKLLGATRKAFTPPLITAYLLRLLLSVPQGVATAVWSLYMADRGASLLLIGLSFTTFALPAILAAPAAGRISDRHGRFWPIVAGLVSSGAIYSAYGFPLMPVIIVLLSLGEGTGAAAARSSVDGLLADSVPSGIRGRVQANFGAADIAGALLGASGGGILYTVGPGIPFLLEGLLMILVAGLLFVPAVSRLLHRPKSAGSPVAEDGLGGGSRNPGTASF